MTVKQQIFRAKLKVKIGLRPTGTKFLIIRNYTLIKLLTELYKK
jgi:hypothetical protein